MSEQNKPFVVTDRRKFTLDGTPRPEAERDAPTDDGRSSESSQASSPVPPSSTESDALPSQVADAQQGEPEMPPPPTEQEMEQANAAYQQTSERLDTAVRAANPGMERPPAMSFEQIVQSIFMSALMQLGATAPEGQQPRVDLLGARQSIDMLGILGEKTKGNLTTSEVQLLDNALFEVRMGFLEVTQALARSATDRASDAPGAGTPGRPSIVR